MIQAFGVTVDWRCGLFGSIKAIGDLWVERKASVRGRRWADYMVQNGSMHLYLGSTSIVLSRPYRPSMAV